MKTKVAINGAEFYAYHGYYDEERKSGNTFLIDAEVTLQSYTILENDIHDTVNYELLYTICKDEMSKTQSLLETVVFNIISRFKNELPLIIAATVKIEKLGPQLGGKVAKSVVEMEF